MSADERAELIARWRERARHLDNTAASYRKMGDTEYAEDLEQAAIDTREASDRLEAQVSA